MRDRGCASVLALAVAMIACACRSRPDTMPAVAVWRLNPNQVDFGVIAVGQDASALVSLTNLGRAPGCVEAFSQAVDCQVSPASGCIDPGESAQIGVTWAPSAEMLLDAVVSLMTTDSGSSELRLSGKSVSLPLQLPGSIDFGVIAASEVSRRTLQVRNRTSTQITATITVNPGIESMLLVEPQRVDLEPAGQATVALAFSSSEAATLDTTLLVESCARCSRQQVKLAARSVALGLTAVPDYLEFQIRPGQVACKEFLLRNDTVFSIVLDSMVTSGAMREAFSVSTSRPLPVVLEPGESLDGTVEFAPHWLGDASGSIEGQLPGAAPLFRIGLRAQAGKPDIQVAPQAVDFGVLPARTKVKRLLTFTNRGDLYGAWVLGAHFDGPGADAFAVVDSAFPLDVSWTPGELGVAFSPVAGGTFDAVAVINTSDYEAPTIRVPVHAEAIEVAQCRVVPHPASLDLGQVIAGRSYVRTIQIVNEDVRSCSVWGIQLIGNTQGHFAVSAPSGTVSLAPGEAAEINVNYFSPTGNIDVDEAAVAYVSPDQVPETHVPLKAFAGNLAVEAVPSTLSFGQVQIGSWSTKQVVLQNTGTLNANVERVEIAGPTSEFSFAATPYYGEIAAGESISFGMQFLPAAVGARADRMQIWLSWQPLPVLIDLTGEGVACNAHDCPASMVANCPPVFAGPVNAPVRVDGSGAHPRGGDVICQWSIVEAPQRSTRAADYLQQEAPCGATFRPDMSGTYRLRLVVRAEDGSANPAQCDTTVVMSPPNGLWIETTWNASADVDLFLAHPNAGFPTQAATWTNNPWVCYCYCPHPSWGGRQSGDPVYYYDDRTKMGPESVGISVPSAAHGYRVGVYWCDNSFQQPAVDVATTIYCDGVVVVVARAQLSAEQEFVYLGEVSWTGPGACTWAPSGFRFQAVGPCRGWQN